LFVCLLIMGLYLFSASTMPFTLTVVTGSQQFPFDFGNRGFSLFYRQIPCP